MMKADKTRTTSITPAHWAGMVSLFIAGPLLVVDWHYSIIVLTVYMVLVIAAPFMPRLGFFLPVISRGRLGQQAVSLTFDDGPDPLSTPALLKLLNKYKVHATFFVSGTKVAQYPHLVKAIIENGHTVGNHSYHHNPMVYFRGADAVRYEIEATQNILRPFGITPRLYRPPVGILSPVLRKPLERFGLKVVNFSCRGFDFGNKRIRGLAGRILRQVKPDDIILLHDTMPRGEAGLHAWLKEMNDLLAGLDAKGLSVLPLKKLIGRPVMLHCAADCTGP